MSKKNSVSDILSRFFIQKKFGTKFDKKKSKILFIIKNIKT